MINAFKEKFCLKCSKVFTVNRISKKDCEKASIYCPKCQRGNDLILEKAPEKK